MIGHGLKQAFFITFIIAGSRAITDALNAGLLPDEYYALAEQQAAGFGPDVLTLQSSQSRDNGDADPMGRTGGSGGLLVAAPKARFKSEYPHEFHRRKKVPLQSGTSAATIS
jgi:hypothetical protein